MFPPSRYSFMRATVVLLLLAIVPSISRATDVVKIEEHWELSVGLPEMDRCAPQVTMVMSPQSGLDNDYFLFTLNYRSSPDFIAGGLQLQRWQGNQLVETADSSHTGILSHTEEQITWTQTLTLQDGVLTLEIENGKSQTWGGFGGDGTLHLSVNTPLTQLNNYQPGVSIEESGISFAGNRVSSLVLQKLVWTTSDGEVHTLVSPIDIDTDIDP